MAFLRSKVALAAALSVFLLLSGSVDAFLKPVASPRTATQVNIFGFLNEGKKALVKSLAGEYDEAAIKARMDGLIAENPVFMFSFTT